MVWDVCFRFLFCFCLRVSLASLQPPFDQDHLIKVECKNGNVDYVALARAEYGDSRVFNARTTSRIWRDGDMTCMHFAAEAGQLRLVEYLLKAGVDVEQRDGRKDTPLHFAAKGGRAEMVKLLLDNNATVDARNVFKSTPLHGAAWAGHVSAMRVLLDGGADIEAQQSDGATPIMQASWKNRAAAIAFLAERGAEVDSVSRRRTALTMAIEWKCPDAARELVRLGASVEKARRLRGASSRFEEGMGDPAIRAAIEQRSDGEEEEDDDEGER